MEVTNDMILKAGKAASVEELMAMAKAEGIELSEEDAEKYYGFLHMEGELSDEELSRVAGGKTGGPKYSVGQQLWVNKSGTQYWDYVKILQVGYKNGEYWYRVVYLETKYQNEGKLNIERMNVTFTNPYSN